MRLGRRPNQQDEAQVDLTSMLDIVFIMLIFFIVTSSFVRESGVEVNRPQASNVVSQKRRRYFHRHYGSKRCIYRQTLGRSGTRRSIY